MITRTVIVGTTLGLHARPAALFAQAVLESGIDIVMRHGDQEVEANSPLSIMTLGVRGGDEVTIATADDSAEETMDDLAAMLSRDLDTDRS
ncbi:HPr family phosphocarrier protein [Bifidobacterium simiarum]|uniref:Phosphocarrier protein HPr n=1 Tax=Bifidobacterium simiarum TaxID=2045441 RepID=A0A2M9HF86_9BIFI|nr:HPr family phosphocarrier protein [Bifidobacterium simiarum]PJM75479.1 HPr family phosphocarrier protein [Bifidobacterium simiarum]